MPVAMFAAAFMTITLASSVAAQQASARFRVLVPRIQPEGDADDDFGEDLANDLRDLIDEFATHQPVDEDEIEDAMDQFDMDWEDLNCIRTTQLASQISSQVILCGGYSEAGGDQYDVNVEFRVVETGESFQVEPITVNEDQRNQAAQHIIDSFDRVVQQTRATAFCQDYHGSQQWERALENCNRAIELNPESEIAHYTKALTLENLDRLEEAMAELETVLEMNPIHENALQWAGNISARLDQNDEARDYYSRYLELNPQDSAVRMRIAYDLAQAGDPVGAMQLIEEGFTMDEDNPALYEQYGNFAFTAATQALEGRNMGPDQELPPEVAEYYRTAIEAYRQVFQMKGDSTNASQLRNVVAAHLQLGETEDAVSFADQALDAYPENARLWSTYADALNRAGQVDQAIAALDSVQAIDPEYANVFIRQGQWLLQAGRIEDAVDRLQEAVERGEQTADVAARLVLANAHSQGIQQDDFQYALQTIPLAKEFDVGDRVQAELDFWHGYAMFQQAIEDQEPATLESAQATLPRFQEALSLFQQAEPYASQQPSINLAQFVENTQRYIEIQEAVIQRESRR
ncbi:MAG: tetratricopeptide repeat protein [Longimicrobiales bacterium]|nr:tetratricopeptide repeat protein [Longimicrobiales bacterium]